jgi:hypothetical protein
MCATKGIDTMKCIRTSGKLALLILCAGLGGGQTAAVAAPSDGNPTACASLTGAALQAVIAGIIASSVKAESDSTAHGIDGVPGGYASAARDNLTYLVLARDQMVTLLDWLHAGELLDGPPFVTNASAAYNVHGYVREAVIDLQYARHWATISAVYHGSADARDSVQLTTQALELIEPLGAQAARCYMEAYGPYN